MFLFYTLGSVDVAPDATSPSAMAPEAGVALFAGYSEAVFLSGPSAWVGGRIDVRVPLGENFAAGVSVPGYAFQYSQLACVWGDEFSCHVGEFVPFAPVFHPAAWARWQAVDLAWFRVSPWAMGRVDAREDATAEWTATPEGIVGVAAALGRADRIALVVEAPIIGTASDARIPVRWPAENAKIGLEALYRGHHRFSVEATLYYLAGGYTYETGRGSLGARWATAGTLGNTAELHGGLKF